MEKERLPRKTLEWCPPGTRRKGRPRISWMQEVKRGLRKRGIGDLVQQGGVEKENKTSGTEICENSKNLDIIKYYYIDTKQSYHSQNNPKIVLKSEKPLFKFEN